MPVYPGALRVAEYPLAQNRLAIWISVAMTCLAENREPVDGSQSESGSGSDLHAGKRLGGLRRGDAFVHRGRFTGPAGESREGRGGSTGRHCNPSIRGAMAASDAVLAVE